MNTWRNQKPEVERENINHCHRAEELEDYWFIPKKVINFFPLKSWSIQKSFISGKTSRNLIMFFLLLLLNSLAVISQFHGTKFIQMWRAKIRQSTCFFLCISCCFEDSKFIKIVLIYEHVCSKSIYCKKNYKMK